MIDAVTLDDAKRVAKRILDNGMLVTVVGRPEGVASAAVPDGGAAGLGARLTPMARPPMSAANSELR